MAGFWNKRHSENIYGRKGLSSNISIESIPHFLTKKVTRKTEYNCFLSAKKNALF